MKKKKYYFIKDNFPIGGLFVELRLSAAASMRFTNEQDYLKAVAFDTKGRATKYIKKYLKPFADISKLEPVAILVNERDEKNLNMCMFSDIQ